ncbi:MAG: hypothetical protein NT131_06735 [Methanomassiliicoccales archaeon]|nr:hypothetical protein [Methanomassiliicoccales archaeon]
MLKYCLHGLGLDVIMFGVTMGWAFLLGLLVSIGWLIGLIIGLAVLIFLFGYINTYVAERVWDISLEIDLGSVFFHGLKLFVFLIIVSIPSLIVAYIVPSWITSVLIFVIYVPIDGYVGMNVAQDYETDYEEPSDYYPSEDL